MLLFPRPSEPTGFAERIRRFRQAVERAVYAGERPVFDAAAWRPYKEILARAQHGKCVYCEVIATSIGDVEHFWPKGALSELYDDPNTWGRELPFLANVEGRKTRRICDLAYWWLAYEWMNLLFACDRCNRAWKGDLFPVAESPRILPPERNRPETPLLLDPYGKENPSRHLRFSDLGQVEAHDHSRIGFETIRTLGLDRDSLQRDRVEKAKRIYDLVRKLRTAQDDEVDRHLRDILEMGDERYPHAGMVRIVFEQATGLSWSDLDSGWGGL